MAATITAAQTADPGAPQVGVTVAGLSTTTASTVVVDRSWDGGVTWLGVRGGTVSGALGSTFVRDYVCPLNTATTYRATVTGGSSEQVTTIVTVASSQAWIQDPLNPRSAVPLYGDLSSGHVLLTLGSLASATWAQHESLATVIGADLPVSSLSVRQKVAALPLVLTYEVAAQGGALRNMLMSAGQLVVRGLSIAELLDPVAHVSASSATEARLSVGQISQWTLTVRQVRPTTLRVVVPWWTYDQVKALIQTQVSSTATYAQVVTAMPAGKTYTDWVANPGVV
ncbi:MAG: hypothetical protein M0Z51_16770 [Propionibacterium sp.]|nr:hypothetical protein [Propionibacterium sp.]